MARRLLYAALAIGLVLAGINPAAARPTPSGRAAGNRAGDRVAETMAEMTPDEIVGQLFLVTFQGSDVGPDTAIADLVLRYHVGGAVLRAGNDNFTDEARLPQQVLRLTNGLQNLRYTGGPPPTAEPGGATREERADVAGTFVPLFVALAQEGDGYPTSALHSGTTALPGAMALGATWRPADAEEIGRINGQELSALGVNMLLGPTLDVLDDPRPETPGGPGTRAFGGDPYWVGLLGQAYIRGVHSGANGRIAIVSGKFPGTGGSDRATDQEVATVWRTLEELRRIDLAPFVAVTSGAGDDPTARTDALLTAHIRYQGFQGNISNSVPPISLDARALPALMALEEFAAWRNAGGLIVSDSLGAPAIKKFYASAGAESFPNRQVARDAFNAGNDVLYLADFAAEDDWSAQLAAVRDTIEYFRELYATDAGFQQHVDQSVARILQLKLALYGDFSIEQVAAREDGLNAVGRSRDQVFGVARNAVTLLAPAPEFLPDRVPSAPSREDDLVIFTDVRLAAQCSACVPRPLIAVDALESAIVRLYGASGQVNAARISSFSFADLKRYLAVPPGGTPAPETITTTLAVESALLDAEWVWFAMLDVTAEEPDSDALKLFLAQRSDLASRRKVIAIAYAAPYYLDSTEVSKLTAYYAAYSKVEPFIDASVRAVFKELPPSGAPPVSVNGVNYDLHLQTRPDRDQDISLAFVDAAGTPTPVQDLKVGDKLRLATGVIFDHNGHPVPDGTLVSFRRVYAQEGLELPPVVAATRGGVALAEVPLEREGALEISAYSEPAIGQTKITITIQQGATPIVTIYAPTDTPTPVPPTPTGTPPAKLTPTPTPQPPDTPPDDERRVSPLDLLGALLGVAALAGVGFRFGRGYNGGGSTVLGVRCALFAAIGGLLAYNGYALGLAGLDLARAWLPGWAPVALAWAGAGLGLLVGRWAADQYPPAPEPQRSHASERAG